jgi:ligand-binding SRPBCC domain-containing protein
MKIHTFTASLTLSLPIERVFEFFADAQNLERLTPPFLKFHIVSPLPIEMKRGVHIRYRLRLHGIPIGWESEITTWEPPHRFVDLQRRGPYRFWRHEHRFTQTAGGTEISDRIDYAVLGGSIINSLLVEPDVRNIFAYRTQRLNELLVDDGRKAGDGSN